MITALFVATTIKLGLPANLLSSLCYVESRHVVTAIHKDDGGSSSLGICQVKLKTAQWLGFKGDAKQLMNPATNILFAGKYLKYQLNRYHGNIPKAVIAYNIGNAKGLTSTRYQRKVFKRWVK